MRKKDKKKGGEKRNEAEKGSEKVMQQTHVADKASYCERGEQCDAA